MTTAPDPAAAARTRHPIPARGRRASRGFSPSPDASGRTLAILGATAVALIVAFVLAPAPLAAISGPHGGFSGQQALSDAFSKAFVDYWKSGDRSFPTGMQDIVDYWVRYHVAKAVIAAALLAVVVALGVRLWRKAVGLGALMAIPALVAAAAVAANIQGTAAPFSSLLSMLPAGAAHGDLATVISQIEPHLAHYPHQTSAATPAVQVMVDDFGRYHAVLAVVAAIASLVLIALTVMAWRRRADRGMLWCAVLTALAALAVLVITAANVSTAADPAPALLAFFQGGW